MRAIFYKFFRRLAIRYWKLLMIVSSTTVILNTQRHNEETNESELPESFVKQRNDKTLPYEFFPVIEDAEVGRSIEDSSVWRFLGFPVRCSVSAFCSEHLEKINLRPVEQSSYEIRAPVPTPEEIHLVSKSKEVFTFRTWPSGKEPSLEHVRDYFNYLEMPQMSCRKLVMLGGSPTCDRTTNFLDGNKLVCLDLELEILSGGYPHKCLTLSFGVNFDTTFDTAMADLPCEVHMFDILDFKPAHLLETGHVYFHKVGLAETPRTNFYTDINESLPVNSLDGFLVDYDLMFRPIHMLKLDIEDDEWIVFKHLVKQPILDAVGQISMEVHAEGLRTLPYEEQLPYIQKRYNVLRAIEERGFRLVAYWPNRQLHGYRDADSGRQYDLCGELLYVNSNWYNVTFKSTLKSFGFQLL